MRQRYSRNWSVAALILTVPAALVVMNLADPPLRSEVKKLLDEPTADVGAPAREAYAYLREVARTNGERPWAVDFGHCGGESARACGVEDVTPEAKARLDQNTDKLAQYDHLMEYGDFVALGSSVPGRVFDPVSVPEPAIHRLFTLQLASWIKSGGEVRAWHLLESSTRFYAAVLKRGDTLLSRLIALVALEANARFVERERKRRPTWRPPTELVDAFALPDATDVLGGAVDAETRVAHQMVRKMAVNWRRLFLRPNETVNRFYDLTSQVFFTDCPEATPSCVPGLAKVGGHLHLANQIGEAFLGEVVNYGGLRWKLLKRMRTLLELKEGFRSK